MKLTKENAEKILTYKKDPDDERDFKFSSTLDCDIDEKICRAPSIVSHEGKMSRAKEQGELGSCVGFALASMKEWQEATEHAGEVQRGKKDHREGKVYDLSESWIYWMAKEIDPWPGEEGTSIRSGMKVLNKLGVPCEGAWEYDDLVKGKPKSWSHLVARWARIGSYWRVENLKELKLALADGPVPIGIVCFEEIFHVNRRGLVSYPRYPEWYYGSHAVCAVGYDDNHRRFGPVIKFKNSWGPRWGSRGYGYLPYSYIDDFMWDAWACKDVKMTKEMLKENKSLFDL